MIYHYNRVSLKPDTSDADREAAIASWRKQGQVIEAVKSSSVGLDVGGEFEYAAVFVVKDVAGYQEYMSNPTHRHTDEIGLPLIEKFVSYDLIDDPDPTIADKIRKIHEQRLADDAGLVDLIQGLGSYTGASNPKNDQQQPPSKEAFELEVHVASPHPERRSEPPSANKKGKPVIYHNLRASFKPGVTEEQKEAVVQRLREQGRVIEAVASVSVGRDFGGAFEYAAAFTFRDVEDYKTYMSHPFHQQTDQLVLPLVSRLDAFALVDNLDPATAERVREVQAGRVA